MFTFFGGLGFFFFFLLLMEFFPSKLLGNELLGTYEYFWVLGKDKRKWPKSRGERSVASGYTSFFSGTFSSEGRHLCTVDGTHNL